MASQERLSVLCVEDHEDFREALTSVLEAEGYEVVAVSTAEDGLAALTRRRFDLVLTDFSLPGQTGSWMVHEARARGRLGEAVVIMVTAHSNPEGTEGIEVVRKPIELESFLAFLGRRVRAARSPKSLSA